MKNLSNLIEIFDNFGINIKLNYNSKDKYKSLLGFIASIIFDILIIILGILVLVTNYSTQNIFITSSKINNSFFEINLTHFPIIFTFENYNGVIINDYSSFFSINLSLNIYDSKKDILKRKQKINLKECNVNNIFKEFKNLFSSFQLNEYKCFDQNIKLEYNETYNSKLIFSIYKCGNCSKDYEEIINNINFVFFSPEYDIYNYNKKNPIQYNLKKKKISFDNNLSKSYSYKFSNNKYISDKGFMFKSNSINSFISISNYENDINTSSNNLLGSISFEHSKQDIEYRKKYIKFQQNLSEIFSLFYLFFIIFKFFVNLISKKVLFINIINSLIKKFPNNGNCTDISPKNNISKELLLRNKNSGILANKNNNKILALNSSKNFLYNSYPFSKHIRNIIMKPRNSKLNIYNIVASPTNKRYYNFVKTKVKQIEKNDLFLMTLKGSEFKLIKMNFLNQLFPKFNKNINKLIEEMIETIDYYKNIENILPIIIRDSKLIDDFFYQKENSISLGKKKYKISFNNFKNENKENDC